MHVRYDKFMYSKYAFLRNADTISILILISKTQMSLYPPIGKNLLKENTFFKCKALSAKDDAFVTFVPSGVSQRNF